MVPRRLMALFSQRRRPQFQLERSDSTISDRQPFKALSPLRTTSRIRPPRVGSELGRANTERAPQARCLKTLAIATFTGRRQGTAPQWARRLERATATTFM